MIKSIVTKYYRIANNTLGYTLKPFHNPLRRYSYPDESDSVADESRPMAVSTCFFPLYFNISSNYSIVNLEYPGFSASRHITP